MGDTLPENSDRFRRRNGRPDFTKVSSMPDVMMRPDERAEIKTFTTDLSATTHHVRHHLHHNHHHHTGEDATIHNLKAIISPNAAKRSLGKLSSDSLKADLPFTMVESDSENSKASHWSPLKQPKKSCMKHTSHFSSSLHDSSGILEAPAYNRYAMAKKKESRWDATKTSDDGCDKGDEPPSPLKTPRRMGSIDPDEDDFSLPSLSTYHTDDLTLGTTSTPATASVSSRRSRKLPDVIPEESVSSRASTVLERKLQKAKGDAAFMSPPVTKETLRETSWTRKDITKSISESSPLCIGEELQSAVASLSDHSKRKDNDITLCPDIRDRNSEEEKASLLSMQESASTILHSNVSSRKIEKKERRTRSRSRSKSRASSKQRGRGDENEGSTKQRGRSIDKEKSRKTGKSVERKRIKDRLETSKESEKSSRSMSPSKRRSSGRSASPKKSTKLRSDSAHRRAYSRSVTSKQYGTALPAPSKKYQSKSRSKSRSKSKERTESPNRRSRAASKSRSPSPSRGKISLKSHSRHKSRSASPTRRRSRSSTSKRRSKSRSESPKRVRSKSRPKSLKAKEAKQVIGDSTHKKKTKKRSTSLRTGSKRESWENSLVPLAGLLPPKAPVKADAVEASGGPRETENGATKASSHPKSTGRKKTLSEASLGVSMARTKDWKTTHEPRKPTSCQLLQKSGSAGALIQQWEERSVEKISYLAHE